MEKIPLVKFFETVPTAKPECVAAFVSANAVLPLFGIMNNERRLAHFLAQVLHESGGLSRLVENLNYITAERIRAVWPSRFPTIESARPYVRKPIELANKVYGGRMGNTVAGDGWRYRGRGLMQITGRDMYLALTIAFDVDFVAEPDLILREEFLLPAAGHVWRMKGCSRFADDDNLSAITRAINGGLTGLNDRATWLRKVRTVLRGV